LRLVDGGLGPRLIEEGQTQMKNRFRMFAALLAVSSLAAFGAGIDGKWTAEVQGGRGPQTQTLTLKASGEKLAGSMEGGRGGAVEISEGMIHGSDVMFKVVRDFGDKGKFEQNFKGTLSGDELKLTMEAGGGRGKGPQEVTFKRAQ
jgi:hypothetical protein